MNKEEFNLSKFRIDHEGYGEYLEEDVKEFIRLLKEKVQEIVTGKAYYYSNTKKSDFLTLEIDKLAGEKLK